MLPDFETLDTADPAYATQVVDRLLAAADQAGASDLHLQPTAEGLDLRWRLDGVLEPIARLPRQGAPNVVVRLKVLAELLTYKTDVPQEGRIRRGSAGAEIRVSTFPTLYGEKAVVRLFAQPGRLLLLDDLGLTGEIREALRRLLDETSGAILVTGPTGSGKTTTLYASLRDVVRESGG
ncbi:MAG: ATPase, T2SS/T4P/T4SS family, partial [Pirellulales bacterium]